MINLDVLQAFDIDMNIFLFAAIAHYVADYEMLEFSWNKWFHTLLI